MAAFLLQNTVDFELNNGWRIAGMLVGVDYPRRRMVLPAQGFGSESARRRLRRVWLQSKKSIVEPSESTARYKYTHLLLTRTYVRVDPSRIVCCLEPFTQAPLQLRRIALHESARA